MLVTGAVFFATADVQAEPRRLGDACEQSACIYVEHDEELLAVARSLEETLARRLCKRGVRVFSGSPSDLDEDEGSSEHQVNGGCSSPPKAGRRALWWTAYLKTLDDEYILIAIDHLGVESDEDFIREVPIGPDAGATAWTLALMIEEVMLPYLETDNKSTPLGAGLAIIEPPEVGGAQKKDLDKGAEFPKIRCIGMGLTLYYLGTVTDYVDNILVGPRAGVQGLLGSRVVASLNATWLGTGSFHDRDQGIRGTISYIPLDLLFGYIIVKRGLLELTVFAGISAGFSIYQTTVEGTQGPRTDVFFDPLFNARLELTVHISGPLGAYANTGAAIPLRTEVLKYNGRNVYEQDWFIPLFGFGLQLWLQ